MSLYNAHPTTSSKVVVWGPVVWDFFQGTPQYHSLSQGDPIGIQSNPLATNFVWNILHAVDGRNPANHQGWWLSHYFLGFTHPRWCRILSINSRSLNHPSWQCKVTVGGWPAAVLVFERLAISLLGFLWNLWWRFLHCYDVFLKEYLFNL